MTSVSEHVHCLGCGSAVVKGKTGRWREPLSIPKPLGELYACQRDKKGHTVEA